MLTIIIIDATKDLFLRKLSPARNYLLRGEEEEEEEQTC